MYLFKQFKQIILSLSIFLSFTGICAMEQEVQKPTTGPDFPVDVWFEIIQKTGFIESLINKEGKSYEEIFKKLDDFRKTSKNAKLGLDKYIAKIGKEKNKPNYTYQKFKADLALNFPMKLRLIASGLHILNKDKNMSRSQKIELALGTEAYDWLHNFINTLTDKQDLIDGLLFNISTYNRKGRAKLENIKFLLKEGANPNRLYPRENLILTAIVAQMIRGSIFDDSDFEFIEELLKNGANPDLKDKSHENLTPLQFAKQNVEGILWREESRNDLRKIIYLLEKYSQTPQISGKEAVQPAEEKKETWTEWFKRISGRK